MRARVNDFYIPQAEPRKKKVCHINRGIFGRELRRRRFHRTQRLRTDAAKTGAVFRPIRREKPLNQGVLGLRRISSCVTRRLTAPDAQNLRSISEFVELLRRTLLRLRAFPLAAVAASRSRESNRRWERSSVFGLDRHYARSSRSNAVHAHFPESSAAAARRSAHIFGSTLWSSHYRFEV